MYRTFGKIKIFIELSLNYATGSVKNTTNAMGPFKKGLVMSATIDSNKFLIQICPQ